MEDNNHQAKYNPREAMPIASGKEGEPRAVQKEKAWEREHVNLDSLRHINVDVGAESEEPIQHSRDRYEPLLYWECTRC